LVKFSHVSRLAKPAPKLPATLPGISRSPCYTRYSPEISPKIANFAYALVGGGYADYEQSLTRIDGGTNPAPRELARGVFDFGAGVDVQVWRFVGLCGEARDFYIGEPITTSRRFSRGQHNIVATVAFVLRWQ
jgi:hypothetical protein